MDPPGRCNPEYSARLQGRYRLGQYLTRREKPAVPQSSRDVFNLLQQAGWSDVELAEILKRMVGFRNIAVHDDQTLQAPIIIALIERHLDDLLEYSRITLQQSV